MQLTLTVNMNAPYDAAAPTTAEQRTALLNNTVAILKKRLESYEVKDLKITTSDKGEISLGFKSKYDIANISRSLTMPGKLELLETYTNEEFFPALQQINDSLGYINTGGGKIKPAPTPTTDTGSLSNYIHTDEGISNPEEEFKKKNPLFLMVMPPIDKNSNLLNGAICGYILVKDTPAFNKMMVTDIAKFVIGNAADIRYGADGRDSVLSVYAAKTQQNINAAFNKMISTVSADLDALKKPCVLITMTQLGAVKWGMLTEANIGKFIAIAVDGFVITCPKVLGKITGGKTELSGDYTTETARELASALNSGTLPAPVTIKSSTIK